MPNTHLFEYSSIIPSPLPVVWAFHQDPSALRKLTPPPLFAQSVRDDRDSLTQGELEFTLWLGPLPVRWTAAHKPGPTEHSFIDRMVKGPLASWVHEHRLDPDPEGVRLSDRIMYSYRPGMAGWPARLLFSRPGLKFLFWYRHWRTRKGSQALAVEPTPGWGSNEG